MTEAVPRCAAVESRGCVRVVAREYRSVLNDRPIRRERGLKKSCYTAARADSGGGPRRSEVHVGDVGGVGGRAQPVGARVPRRRSASRAMKQDLAATLSAGVDGVTLYGISPPKRETAESKLRELDDQRNAQRSASLRTRIPSASRPPRAAPERPPSGARPRGGKRVPRRRAHAPLSGG